MTSENVAEYEAVESAAVVSAKAVDDQLIDELVSRAQAEGLQLTGEGGLLQQLTKRLLESALEGEITDHLGYDKHDPAGKNGANSRNGKRSKTVLTDVGPVETAVPRDRDGSFEPKIVKKRQKRLTGVDEMVISLAAKGLTTGESRPVSRRSMGPRSPGRPSPRSRTRSPTAWPSGRTGRSTSFIRWSSSTPSTSRSATGRSPTGRSMWPWPSPPRGGGRSSVVWAGDGGEGAKHWLHILTEIKNRGVNDVLMLVCDGLKGLPEAVETVWPRTVVQTCVVHLLRNSVRCAARQDRDKIARLLKPVHTAPTEEAALERFAEFVDAWGRKYPAIVKPWENAWEEFTPFLRFDTEIRRIVCTTNAIESVNARIRRAVKARGHFPNEQAALECVYMAIMSPDPTGKGQARWTMRWKTALNAFDITFDGRLSAARR
ncbi:IS256 family transposase [Streptomyces axinellae]|uniref:Mutator family transposase n=1 Tax=Streptomyces axinellae TaxID=552788 RepID=A0ABP6DG08_9ACTN